LEEFSLLHILGELSYALFKLLDIVTIPLVFLYDEWLDLLFDSFLDVLKLFPLLVHFVESLDLVVDLGNFGVLEQEEGFIKLVNAKGGLVSIIHNPFNSFLDSKKLFHILQVLVLGVNFFL
jgi:hypothetical protein